MITGLPAGTDWQAWRASLPPAESWARYEYERGPCHSDGGQIAVLIDLYLADPPAAAAGWIWDTHGTAAAIMLARARAAGQHGGIPAIVPPDVIQAAAAAAARIRQIDLTRPDVIAAMRSRGTWTEPT